jgi:hypothetical protein
MYISIRNDTDVKTWGNLLTFATNEITLFLNDEGYVEQRVRTVFSNDKIKSTWRYDNTWSEPLAIRDYIQSKQCREKLESQGYKLYKIEEVII